MKDSLYTIQEASAFLKVSANTLRRWEEQGIIKPIRTAGNQRRYRHEDLQKISSRRRYKRVIVTRSLETPVIPPAPQKVTGPVIEESQKNAIHPIVYNRTKPHHMSGIPFPQIYQNLPENQSLSIEKKNRDVNPKKFFGTPSFFQIIGALSMILLLVGMFDTWYSLNPGGIHSTKNFSAAKVETQNVLAATTAKPVYQMQINIPGIFGKKVTFLENAEIKKSLKVAGLSTLNGGVITNNANIDAGKGKVTASNLVYSVHAGSNISVTGDAQNPTISATLPVGVSSVQGQTGAVTLANGTGIGITGTTISNTGVLSLQGTTGAVTLTTGSGITLNGLQIGNSGVLTLQGQTGNVTLSQGSGIGISGTTISNTDTGSAQNIFKTITAGGTNIVASSNNDTVNFAAGSGITLTGDSNSKTVTITSNASGVLQNLTPNGVLYATSSNTAGSTTPGTNGQVLHGITAGAPVFSAVDLTADVTGVLPIGNGGTGVSGTPTNGQVLIGNGSGYTIGNIAQGAGIDVTDSPGGITVTNTGVTSLTGTPNQISLTGNTGIITLSLPQNIDTSSTPTFAALNLTSNTNQLTLGSGTTGVITLATLTSGRTYVLPDTSGTICLSTGNCVGTGGLIGGSGSPNFIAKFTGGGTTLADSSIFDNGQVGIGTSSPQGLFSVSGGVIGNALVTLNDTAGQNILVGSEAGTTRFAFDSNGNLNIIGGAYQIGGTNMLSSTTLGSSVVTSSLTSVGALNAGSITSGFGNIDVGADSIAGGDITSSGTTGYTASGIGAGLNFSGSNNHLITASSGVLQLGAVTLTGAITGGGQNITGLGTINGLAINPNTGTITAGTWNASTIGTTYGGTGINGSTAANGTLLIGNGTGYSLNNLTAGAGILIDNSTPGHITIAQTGSGSSKWTQDEANGVLYPNISTLDVLLGGNATSSATFAFTNNASGTPTEIISNGGGNSLSLSGDGNIIANNGQDLSFTTSANMNFQDLNLSGPVQLTNGATSLDPGLTNGIIDAINIAYEAATGTGGSNGVWTVDTNAIFPSDISHQVGIGVNASAPVISSLYVTRDLSGSGALGTAVSIFDQPEAEDIIAASASGITKFVVANDGSLKFDGGSGFLNTITSQAVADQTVVIPQLSGSDTVCFHDLGNCVGAGSGVTASGGVNKQIAFFTGATTISSNSNLFYDYTKNLLGIGNSSPVGQLDVKGAVPGKALVILDETGDQALLTASASGVTQFTIDHTGNLTAAGNETIQGTTGATYSGSGAGITFSGSGTHLISKSSGTLQLGALTFGGAITGNSQNITGLGTINGLAITPDTGTITSGTWNATTIGPTFGGTGQTSYTTGDMLYSNASNSLAKLSIGSSGQILTVSGGVPVWTTAGGSVNFWQLNNGALSPFTISNDLLLGATATASARFGFLNNAGGTPTATISAGSGNNAMYLTGNGSLATTNRQTLNIGSGSTGNIVLGNGALGVSLNLGSDTTGDLYYRNASGILARLAIGGASQILTVSGGVPVWSNAGGSINFWQEVNGALSPLNINDDLLLGATATSSARFGFLNNAGGVPTASISAASGNNAMYLTGTGSLATTNRQTLNIGSSSTGNIVIGNGASGLTLNLGSDTTGDLYYRSSSGTLSRLGIGGASQILTVSGGVPVWSNAGGTINFWQETNGAVAPLNITDDLLFGATATSSAKFAVLNMAGGTPVASVAGNFIVMPTIVNGSQVGGKVGIGTTAPTDSLYISDPTVAGISLSHSTATVNTGRLYDDGNLHLDGGGNNLWLSGTNIYLIPGATHNVGINTSNPLAVLDVRGANGTNVMGAVIPAASFSAQTTSASVIVDQSGSGDLFTASKSGAMKFTIRNDGSLVGANYTTNNGLLYTNGSGIFQQLAPGTNGTCLTITAGALTWSASCSGSGTNFWQEANGTLAPVNLWDDLLLGATGTTSAKFGFVNNGVGVPTASISAASGSNATYLTGSGILATTNRQTLSLGSSTTGNIVIGNGASGVAINLGSDATGDLHYRNSSGTLTRLGIGSNNNCLLSNGSTPFWNTCPGGVGSNVWQEILGALSPINSTDDLLLGATATSSAKFAVLNMAGGTPVASVAGNFIVMPTIVNGSQVGGNVGIGTTNPLTALDVNGGSVVNGGARILGSSSDIGLQLINNSANTGWFLDSAGSGTFYGSGNLSIYQVGLGGNPAMTFYKPSNMNGAGYGVSINSLNSINSTLDVRAGRGILSVASISGATSFANLVVDQSGSGDLFTASKSGATKFVINNKGQVGIGTNNPTFDLDVELGGNVSGAVQVAGSASNVPFYLNNTGTNGQLWGMTSSSNGSLNGAGALTFATFGNSPLLTLLSPNTTGTSGGKAGINMPVGDFLRATFDVRAGSGTVPIASFSGATAAGALIVDQSGTGDIFSASKSGATKFVITNAGNVGIGTNTSNNAYLTVNGNNFLGNINSDVLINDTSSLGSGNVGHLLRALTPAEGAGGMNNIEIGTAGSTNNLGYMGFFNIGAGNANNFLTFGLYGHDNLLDLFPSGSLILNDPTPSAGNQPLATLDVRGNVATTPIASFSGATTNASLIVDQSGRGDIFTASKSGATKFTILNNGNIKLNNYTTAGGVLYTSGTGLLTQTPQGSSGQILESTGAGGAPTWVDASTVGVNFWQSNNNALSPGSITNDLLLGGTATNSAKFGFLNNAGGTPTASISAQSGTNSALVLAGDGSIQSVKDQTLTLGGTTTGNITLSPLNGAGTTLVNGTLNLTSGKTYQIGGTDVLSATTLGSGIVNSSLTSVGALNSGSITSGFGAIDVGSDSISGGNLTGTGNITFSNATFTSGNNQVLYSANGTGVLNTATTNTANLCLISNASAPSWATCPSTNYWQLNTNALSPGNSTFDFLLGGTATTSAKFALTGNAGLATPVASIAATPSSGGTNGLSLSGTGTIQSLNGNTLTIGGTTTGNIVINSSSGLKLNTVNNASITTGTGLVTTGGNLQINGNNIQDSNAATRLTFSTNILSLVNTTTLTDNNLGTINSSATLGISATTLNIGNGSNAALATTSNGNLTLTSAGNGQTLLSSDADSGVAIGAANGTAAPLVINGGIGNNGALIVNQKNSGDLFDASSSGTTKFALNNSGDILLSGTTRLSNAGVATLTGLSSSGTITFSNATFTGNNAVIYGTAGSGQLATATTGSTNQCLLSSASTPAWGSCDIGTTSWAQSNGAIYPGNSTEDLLIGGTATTSAKFAVLNIAGGTPTASIAGNFTVMPTIIGGSQLGGKVGIGTTVPVSTLDVVGSTNDATKDTLRIESNNRNGYFYANYNASVASPYATIGGWSVSANNFVPTNFNQMGISIGQPQPAAPGALNIDTSVSRNNALVNINQGASFGDIFTASQGGVAKFTITNAGGIAIGNNQGSANQCIVSNGSNNAVLWASCPAANGFFTMQNGLLYTSNTTEDFAIGGTATKSADFAFINVNAGTPTASISALNAGTGQALALEGNGGIETVMKKTLTIGGSTTGDIQLKPGNSGSSMYLSSNGNVGIGTTIPNRALEVDSASIPLVLNTTSSTGENGLLFTSGGNTLVGAEVGYVGTDGQIITTANSGDLAIKSRVNDIVFATGGETEVMRIEKSGDVGIGTTNPTSPLQIGSYMFFGEGAGDTSTAPDIDFNQSGLISAQDHLYLNYDSNNDGTGTFQIKQNADTTAGRTILEAFNNGELQVGNYVGGNHVFMDISDTGASNDDMLRFDGTGIAGGSNFINARQDGVSVFNVDGNGRAVASGGFNGQCRQNTDVVFSAADTRNCNMDVAEVYNSSENMSPGDVASIDKTNSSDGTISDVKKSSIAYDPSIMGVVSTNPGLVLGYNGSAVQLGGDSSIYGETADPRKPAIALNGKVPIKVSSRNGPIDPGDALTTSDIPGVAMKATQPGFILGKALGEYHNNDPNAVGTIMVFVNISWVDPGVTITDAGNLSIYPNAPSTGSLIQTYGVKDANGADITRIGAFADAVIGNITAGTIRARDIMLADGSSVKDRLNNLEQTATSSATKVNTLGNLVSALTSRVASLEAALNQQNTAAPTNNLALPTADTTALQTQNGTGTSTYTIERAMPNPVSNPDFEQPLGNEWQGAGHATITRITTDHESGTASLQIRTSEVNDGAENTLTATLNPATTYTLSWYLKSGTQMPQGIISAGYSSDGSVDHQTLCGQVNTAPGTNGWTEYSCSFTTPATDITSSNAIFIGQNDVTLRTFTMDNVQLELANAIAVSGNSNGGLALIGSASASLESSGNTTNVTGTTDLPYVVKDGNGNPVMQRGVFANVVSGNLQAGGINAQKLILSGRDVNVRLNTLENDSSSAAVLVNKVNDLNAGLNNLNDRVASLVATFSLLASGSALFSNPLASFTASSASELDLDKLTVNTNLTVLGKTTVADLGVTGRVTIGLLAIDGLDMSDGSGDAFASLNTTAGPFKIQSQDLNGVEFEGGKLTIDTDGNIKTKGAVTATKYNISTSDVAGASLGVGTLSGGDTSVVINTSAVGKNSTIFVTPKSKTSQPLSVTTQTAGKSFKVEIDSPADNDIKFNWWIVN